MRRRIVESWHRVYDPETGRYISADPIGLAGGINLYAYVDNDPVNFVDPTGLKSCNGTWRRHSWHRVLNASCVCYWVCVPCEGEYMVGTGQNLPRSYGVMYESGYGGVESGDNCLCKKPGESTGCDEECEDKVRDSSFGTPAIEGG